MAHAIPALNGVNLELLARAIRSVATAVAESHISDCLLYAHVGAAVLAQLGVPDARPVAGSAVWRVGQGDGDVVAHAIELQGPTFAANVSSPALPFHAWIALPGLILDFTTWTLPDKARKLDEIDGGFTEVEWAPDMLFVSVEAAQSIHEVRQAAESGAFAYVRHTEVEGIIRRFVPEARAVAQASAAVLIAYRRLLAGIETQVLGCGAGGEIQAEPPNRDFIRIL